MKSASTVFASSGTTGTAEWQLGAASARRRCRRRTRRRPGRRPRPRRGPGPRRCTWPNVRPRTATPVDTVGDVGDAGHRQDLARLRTSRGVPLSVGARQTMVGFAPATSRSRVNSFVPVTAARASVRLCGVPITEKSARSFSVDLHLAGRWRWRRAWRARRTTPSRRRGRGRRRPWWSAGSTSAPSTRAAAARSCCRAIAAATRIGGVGGDGGVGPAGELVEHQLRAGVGEGDPDPGRAGGRAPRR